MSSQRQRFLWLRSPVHLAAYPRIETWWVRAAGRLGSMWLFAVTDRQTDGVCRHMWAPDVGSDHKPERDGWG